MKRTLMLILALLFLVLFSACSNKTTNNTEVVGPSNMQDLMVSDDFNYETSRDVAVQISVLNANDEAVPGIPFEIYNADPQAGGDFLGTGTTNAQGMMETRVVLPTYKHSVFAVGFMSTHEIAINSSNVAPLVIGGSEYVKKATGKPMPVPKAGGYVYITPFDASGKPTSGLTTDVIPSAFLSKINATLPESRPMMTYHPDYLVESNQLNVKIDALSDVWITFVTEGAGYQNSLGFFTFPSNNPPTSVSQIDTLKIIFPNASLGGSGGSMASGNKIKIGRFPAGVSIGWFVVANGWTGSGVGSGYARYFSINALNPETADRRQHSILVYDDVYQKLLFAFEDLNRNSSGCDHDFNDCVFYASVNPVDAVDMTGVPPIDQPIDTDGDGISNVFDDYPSDPTKAFDNFYPSANKYGTLGFEDLWPVKGDYDFNDMILDYNIDQITNAQGYVVQIKGDMVLRAIGASLANGFGIELPFDASKVLSVSGTPTPVLETDATKAVIRLFDNAFNLIPQVSNEFINTIPTQEWHTPQNLTFTVNIKSGMNLNPSSFNHLPPYNPFLFQNQSRGHEVHLPNYAPTSKMTTSLFGTQDDNSQASAGRYFKTADNLPWAINIAEKWDYPIEKKQITWGYLVFRNWAQTNGTTFTDWYKLPQYKDNNYIYPSHTKK